ncbi:dihydrolipoyl dehydrogenase family protein [Parenemella sanctibonifatiensis]|uniref:Pyridine nucleotide-disulfide oxidoreductase n=1 Tax=Parenemella sanctibonifatiensis TaxID=2016505 RepID=A0A255ELF1_9ACTN|nr:NAD(P)/FAD-dependent oxidoreductase [Parenemella sanctibonifatiensis]OYN90282.1 pyridine nucleotide-disulfide oxidoreductase [Parenemella sanctibonifatiensis]
MSGADMDSNHGGDPDLIVIGGGPVGENIAQYATEDSDLTAMLVEAELVGGECSYWACMPSKALLRPIEVRAAAAHLEGITTPELDTEALLARRDVWVSHYDDSGQVEWAEGAGITVVRGHGRLTGERQVTVTSGDGATTVLTARRAVVIATGSEAVIPAPYRDIHPWISRDATGVRQIPGRLVIVGGGVVACEAATWLRALGSEVTMLVRGDRILSGVEPAAAAAVRSGLEASGVRILTGCEASEVARTDAADTGVGLVHGGEVHLTTPAGELVADEVLVATGRRPRLDDVGLDQVGLEAADVLDGRTPDWLVAVGDASGEAPLTHWGKYRARVIGEQLRASWTGQPAPQAPPAGIDRAVPQVIFTDPQVAAVGLTEVQATDAGHDVVTATVPFNSAGGSALLRDDADGVATLVVDTGTRTLLGATFAGPEAAELVHAATIAIVGEVPVALLRHAVPSYPTASELWLRLLEELPRDYR